MMLMTPKRYGKAAPYLKMALPMVPIEHLLREAEHRMILAR